MMSLWQLGQLVGRGVWGVVGLLTFKGRGCSAEKIDSLQILGLWRVAPLRWLNIGRILFSHFS